MFLLFFLSVAVAVRRDQCPYLPVGRCSLGADLLVLQAGAGLSVAGVLRQSFQNLGHGAVFCSPAGGDAEGRTGNHADHLHPPQGIEPKLVWFHTPLKTDRRRAMLADSITLTAGTITVRAEDGRMLVHTLDTPLAEGIEDSSFQQRLERMEAAQWNK